MFTYTRNTILSSTITYPNSVFHKRQPCYDIRWQVFESRSFRSRYTVHFHGVEEILYPCSILCNGPTSIRPKFLPVFLNVRYNHSHLKTLVPLNTIHIDLKNSTNDILHVL